MVVFEIIITFVLRYEMTSMAESKLRMISDAFAKAVKDSCLYELYLSHPEELFLGVRGGYVNLYYNSDSIAKVTMWADGALHCKIHSEYVPSVANGASGYLELSAEEIVGHYGEIVRQSKARDKHEKSAQQKLMMLNNSNPASGWFCVDLEYCKSGQSGRFDIIAISKHRDESQKHRVALIELKYGSTALGGTSGIRSHVADFADFTTKGLFASLRGEIALIIESQSKLGVNIPKELDEICVENIAVAPEFYFITLDNNAELPRASTPKQTIAGYIFPAQPRRWGCRRTATKWEETMKPYGDITRRDNVPFCATFLFSTQTLANLSIDDIIDGDYTEKVIPQ